MAGFSWNPLDKYSTWTLSNDDLTAATTYSATGSVRAKHFIDTAVETRKFYYEVTIDTYIDGHIAFGVGTAGAITYNVGHVGQVSLSVGYVAYYDNGYVNNTGAVAQGFTPLIAGDVIGVGFDPVTRLCTFYKNGVIGAANMTVAATAGLYTPMMTAMSAGPVLTANFGLTAFVALPANHIGWAEITRPPFHRVQSVSSPRPVRFIGL